LFSYNRAPDLLNAVRSFELHAGELELVVFDDNSDDRPTLEALSAIGARHKIFRAPSRVNAPRGGLYRNMQRALEYGLAHRFKYCLFTQDDIQAVRPLEAEDVDQIRHAFRVTGGVVQVAPRFVGRANFSPDGARYPVDPRHAMLDVGIFDLGKLASVGWVFKDSEIENSEMARAHGWCRIHMPDPFLAHAPWPRTYWRGKRGLVVSVTDWVVGAKAHRFVPMTPDDVLRLRTRSRKELPKAEDWLAIEGSALRPWGYMASDWEIRDRLKRTLPGDVQDIARAFGAVFRRSA